MRRLSTALCAMLGLACNTSVYGGRALPPANSLTTRAPSSAPSSAVRAPEAARSSHGSAAVGSFVRAREPQLQFCYRDARAASPNLVGSATVSVTLAPASGRVITAEVVRGSWSGKGGDAVERCVLSRVRAWTFPPTDSEDERQVHSFAVIFTS